MISAFLNQRKPNIPQHSVCIECKMRNIVCIMVSKGIPCMGPVTHSGCGAICPAYNRGCYGCFGPMETPNTSALSEWWKSLDMESEDLVRKYRGFNACAEAFLRESELHEKEKK